MPFIVPVVVCCSKIESSCIIDSMVKCETEENSTRKAYKNKIKYQYVNARDVFHFLLPIAVLSWR